MNEKNDKFYKSISEVAKLLDLVNKKNGKLNTHTLRFWEKNFKQIKPKIFAGKRRYYDNNTIEIIKKIKYLLKDQGMTINGVKKCLIDNKYLKLDDLKNNFINNEADILKNRLLKISKLIKEIKKIG